MTITSSEYGFPIFISSTDYNLIDLRAELAQYLTDLGYKPILSSSDGFHDNSPELEPWESCLQVLQSTYVMVLVIDGKYGEKFEWKNFASIIGERNVSPTHAEYLFAHKTKMRMLVFIRKELMTYYQIYRTTLKNLKGDKEKVKENLSLSLPKHIAFETLEFIQEVKTSSPIPWIKQFENVTEIKREIQKKMLNELAELFLFKNKHLESVIRIFSTILYDLPENKRKETLEKIGTTKELIVEIETQTKLISDLKKEKDKLQIQLTKTSEDLEKAQNNKDKQTIGLQEKVKNLTKELGNIGTRIISHEINNANYLITGTTTPYSSSLELLKTPTDTITGITNGIYLSSLGLNPSYTIPKVCDKCKTNTSLTNSIVLNTLKTCPSCSKKLCENCFNGTGTISFGAIYTECADCRNNNGLILKGTKIK
ncbi:hypothetical protein GCM10022422_32950 [Flavobacterium ginsengisoli]|uniref:DUF4062 domain-containing protein n=1 Tax=Flavobacterium ginsengisoli TaxID=871694 RepID=A0ABP7FS26_9FLAO|nr:DUF4062 domain-containing protein [Flavobacterium ginsengisoli]